MMLALASLRTSLILMFENVLSPSPTRHHELATATIRRGAYSRHCSGGRDRRRRRAPAAASLVWAPSVPSALRSAAAARTGGQARPGNTSGSRRGRRCRSVRIDAIAGSAVTNCEFNVNSMPDFRTHPDPSQWDDYVDFESTSWPKKERRRYWIIPTICFNCESACGILAYVDKETMDVRKIEGNPMHPGSRGRTCAKGVVTPNQLEDPDRILYPLRRAGERGEGEWERVTWDARSGHRRPDPQGHRREPAARADVSRRPPGRRRLRESRAAGVGHRRAQQPHQRLLIVGAARALPVDGRGPSLSNT